MTTVKIKVSGGDAVRVERTGMLTTGMVGAVARFSFDSVWNGLTKVAVFHGSGVTKDVLEWDGDCVRIPAEVLRKQGQLSVGVEGRNTDGSVVIPTVWVECGVVVCGANASGDVSTDPDLPVWAQIQSQIGPLEELQTEVKENIVGAINEALRSGGGSVDEDAVERIVEAYLAENPPEGGTVDPEAVGQMVEAYLAENPPEGGTVDPEAVGQIVEAYLAEHPPVGGDVQVDSTMKVSGAAADAAVVGSQLTTIKEYMYSQEKVAKFITTSPAILAVDTDRKQVKVYGGLLYYRGERTNIPETIVSIDQTSALSYTVWDVVDKAVKSIDPATFDGTGMFLIGILSRDYPTNTNYNYVPGPYDVNGYLYNAPVSQPVYVSTDGSDAWNAIGDRIHPFRTIGKAIASGAKTIIVFAGTYREPVSLSRTGDEFELLCKPVYQSDGTVLDKVVIDLSAQLDMVVDSTTGLVKAAYASTEEDFIHKVFVGRTEALVCDDTFIEKGYTCNLWRGNTKLRPVLSLAECQATAWTWFYDGANVYANAAPGAYCLNDGAVDYGVALSYFRKVKLLGIEVRHAKSDGVKLLNCSDAEITGCVFGYSGVYTGLALENTSAIVRGCEAKFNRTDGLNIHGTGIADFIDCVSHDNGDDGISHHDHSGGMVIGGDYYRNGKGGVCSPTFGSRNGINGVNVHDNGVGVYAVADGAAVDGYSECAVSNCVIRNNGVGIKTQYYKLECWGNVLEGNDTDVVEEYGGIVEIVRDSIPAPATAQVGQTIVVKEVDESGKPVSWECVDVPAGGGGSGGWKKLVDHTTEVDTLGKTEYADITFKKDKHGEPLKAKNLFFKISGTLSTSSNMRVEANYDTSEGFADFALVTIASGFLLSNGKKWQCWGEGNKVLFSGRGVGYDKTPEYIENIQFTSSTTLLAGARFEIWEVSE